MIYGYILEMIILGCVHSGVAVGALVTGCNPEVSGSSPPSGRIFIYGFYVVLITHLVGGLVEYYALVLFYSRLVYGVFS